MRMRLLVAVLLAAGPGYLSAQNATAPDLAETTLAKMQMMIHHAMETAAEGAQLVALGQESATAVDALAIERGRAMIADAKALIREVAAGDTMMSLHRQQLSDAANSSMIATHRLEQAASSYIKALEDSLPGDTKPIAGSHVH